MKYFLSLFLASAFLFFCQNSFAQSKHWYGSWKTEQSSVRNVITKVDGKMSIQAIDDSDGEILEVSDLKIINDQTISLTLHTPSTDYTIQSIYTLKGKKKYIEKILKDPAIYLTYEKM